MGFQCLLEKCLLHGSLIGFYCLKPVFSTPFCLIYPRASSVRLKTPLSRANRQCVLLINSYWIMDVIRMIITHNAIQMDIAGTP